MRKLFTYGFMLGTACIMCSNSFSQLTSYNWGNQVGSTQNEIGTCVAVDAAGNTITAGQYYGTVDLDPGIGTANVTSNGGLDFFVRKLDASGNLVWYQSFGGAQDDYPESIDVDASGNVWATGGMRGTIDFDPGIGMANVTSAGGVDPFILNLDVNGNYVWAGNFGGTQDDVGRHIAVDGAGDVTVSGFFRGTGDFDPGIGVSNLTVNGSADIFIARLDANGVFQWAHNFGSTGDDDGHAVAVDNAGNVYATGYFNGNVDFDPGVGTFNLNAGSGSNVYILNLDAAGNFGWANQVGAGFNDIGIEIQVDNASNILVTGRYAGTVDFDPGTGTQDLTAVGGFDIFIAKYNNTGNYLWAKSIGDSQNDEGYAITTDADNNVYACGFYRGSPDFDPGTGTDIIPVIGFADAYILQLDSDGNYVWASNLGDTNNDHAFDIDCGPNGSLSFTGYFNGTADFDPTAGSDNYTSIGGSDCFFANMSACQSDSIIDYISACDTYTWIDGMTYTASNNSATHILTNSGGCDSVITLNLTITTIIDQTLTSSSTSLCDSGMVTVTTASSEMGIEYYLRDDSDDSVIDGPIAGDGNALVLNAGMVNTTTTYNVFAENIESSISFDGVDDELTIPGVDISNSSFTIEFWGKRDALEGNDYFVGNGVAVTNQGLHIGFRPTNEFTFAFWSNDVNTPPYTDLDWHHWGLTYDANTNERKVYRDGIEVASDVATNDYMGTGMLFLGDTPWGTSNLNGNIDEFRVWSDVKSPADIQGLMNACLSGNEANLMTYHKLDATAGTASSTDLSTGGNDGTLVNMDTNAAWEDGVGCVCSIEMTQLPTVTVNQTTTSTINTSSCDSYTVPSGDETYTMTGMYMDTIPNMAGCDSIITINLTIGSPDITVTTTDPTITSNATGVTYQWLDCNNAYAPIAGETGQAFTATTNGDYAVEIMDGSCVDTSACVNIATVSLDQIDQLDIAVYPNPSNGTFWVEVPGYTDQMQVRVFAMDGKEVYRDFINNGKELISLQNMQAGIYTLEILINEQRFISKVRLF